MADEDEDVEQQPQSTNYFDQFDAPTTASAPQTNYFDKFDAPAAAPAAVPAPQTNYFDRFDKPQQPQGGFDLGDVVKSAAIGVPEGLIGGAGAIGDVRSALSSGVDYLTNKLGIDPTVVSTAKQTLTKAIPGGSLLAAAPTSEQLQKGVESVTGPFYQPKTVAGEYARTVGSFLPFAVEGPEGIASRIMTQAVIPGVASELAGQVTKGTPYETPARIAGGLFGGAGATLATERAVRAAAERPPSDVSAPAAPGATAPEVGGVPGADITPPVPHRSGMPDTGGVAKTATPPIVAGDEQPVNTPRDSKEAATQQVEGAQGVNVLQPGQSDPTVASGLRNATEAPTPETASAAPAAEPAAPPPAPAPAPAPEPPRAPAPTAAEPAPTPAPAAEHAPGPEPPAAPPGQEHPAVTAYNDTIKLLNQPADLRVEAARRGMTPDALRTEINAQLPQMRETALAAQPDAALAQGEPGVRRPPRGEKLKIPQAERELGEGQPVTKPIKILERGLQRVEEGVPPSTAPPPMETLRRQARPTPKPAPAAGAGGGPPPPGPPPGAPGAGPTSRAGSPKAPAPVAATAADLQTGPWANLQRWLGVRASSTPSGRAARDIYMKAEGRAERERQVAAARFTNEMHRLVNATPPDEQRKLVNWIQGGNHFPGYQPDPKILPVVDQVRATYRDFENYITSLPKFQQMQFWDNSKYLTGQYKDPVGAHNFYSTYAEAGPSAGGRGSLMKRKFATDEDARAAGLEPASTNPIQRVMWYTDSMSRYLSKTRQIEDGKAGGYIKYYGPEIVGGAGTPQPSVRGAPPQGWAALKGVQDEGGRQAFAPREYAATFNNAYSPGLSAIVPENIVQGARRALNTYTAAELAGPAYHALNTTHEGLASHWANAVSLALAGKPVLAARSAAKGVVSPLSGLPSFGGWNPLGKQADRIMDVYLNRAQNVTPQERAIVDAMQGANWKPIGISHTLDYEMSKAGSLLTSAMQGALKAELKNSAEKILGPFTGQGVKGIPSALAEPFNLIGRVSQTIAHPLFQYYIPRMKATAAYDNIRAWLDVNPHATPEQLHEATVRILKSIDNRMGEMAQDNMLMNRGARDIMSFAMRSPSFSIGGVIREIAAGTLSLGRGALKGEMRASMASKNYDPRTAYAISFFAATGAITAAYQYLKTGKMPSSDDLENIMLGVAKTGGKVPGVGGKHQVDEEAIMPGYNKDFRGYYHDFWGELKNKQPGLYQRIEDQIANEQWKGPVKAPIVPPGATLPQAAAARARAFAESSVPIMGKQAGQTPYKGSNISYPEQVMGIRAPGTWQSDPKAYQASADKRAKAAWDQARRRENLDRANRGLPPLPMTAP